jgi:uncharacterized protein YndB with AHSA1/START domain
MKKMTMTNKQELSLTVSNTINAPVEKVFDAWLDPHSLAKFMRPKPGMKNPAVELEAKQGGKFRIEMNVGDEIIPHCGEYLEIDRPHRLSFSWESPFSGEDSRVTIDFLPVNATTTKVTLNHVRFPSEESRDNHQGGWVNILAASKEVI